MLTHLPGMPSLPWWNKPIWIWYPSEFPSILWKLPWEPQCNKSFLSLPQLAVQVNSSFIHPTNTYSHQFWYKGRKTCLKQVCLQTPVFNNKTSLLVSQLKLLTFGSCTKHEVTLRNTSISWLCINYVNVKAKNRFSLWNSHWVSYSAYTNVSGSALKKCSMALKTVLFYTTSPQCYVLKSFGPIIHHK